MCELYIRNYGMLYQMVSELSSKEKTMLSLGLNMINACNTKCCATVFELHWHLFVHAFSASVQCPMYISHWLIKCDVG